uniref:DUF3575 domain-containing protein n=1 Tax=Alistipes sp. TaxID=1872444 RepID=UPI0040561F32
MRKFLLYLFLIATAIVSVSAKERVVEHRIVVDIPFSLAGGTAEHIRFDMDSVRLAHSLRELELLDADEQSVIKRVEFYSSVSPEGTRNINTRLSKERIATAENIIRSRLTLPMNVEVVRNERYIPWSDGLLPAIKADKSVPYRDELLSLCVAQPDAKGDDSRLERLKSARGGELWEIVQERYFDHLRRGGAVITVERVINDELISKDIFGEMPPIVLDGMLSGTVQKESAKSANHAISIKTNAAAVAALITNIGIEVKLAPRWSLDLMGAYSPYNMIVPNRKIRLFGGRPEVRFWWGEPMKRGHFLGLHGFASAFNVQLGNKARYQDPNHVLWGAGLAYGYALPLGKKERWGVEFTIGLGYARIKYDKYDGAINGQFIERKTVNYYGPTRLGVNFSYRFDIEGKQKNNKK